MKIPVHFLPAFAFVLALGAQPVRAAEVFEDPLLTLSTAPEVMEKGAEADAYHLAVSAYVWGYPLVRMERVIRQYTDVPEPNPGTSYRAPLNRIGWARDLATPDAKDMPTANNDTLYMSAVVKLDQPWILSVPDTHDRYYVVNVFNMWQELEHYVGRRTTGTKAGRYALVPPGWTGELPKDVKRLDVSTSKVWLWGRLHILQGEPKEPVLALQKGFSITPLKEGPTTATAEALAPLPSIAGDELGFFKHLAYALKDNTIKPQDVALFGQYARIGLTEDGFDPSKLSPAARRGFLRGLADAPMVAASSLASATASRDGWTWASDLDNFGVNYALRAMVAGPYLGANGLREALYPLRTTDADGNALSGANRYEVRFDKEPPVGAFWSLTMYDDADKMLVANPIDRFKVGSDTPGLKRSPDGAITIPVQAEAPAGEAAANWLPAPKGKFYLLLRLYQPSEEILDGSYPLPQIRKIP